MDYAKLNEKKEVVSCSMEEWVVAFEIKNRRVGHTELGSYEISTVFLGLNHGDDENPEWFETMTFDEHHEEMDCIRCATYEEALKMHGKAVTNLLVKVFAAELPLMIEKKEFFAAFKSLNASDNPEWLWEALCK